MDELTSTLRLLSNCMDKMHVVLSNMKSHVEDTGNPEAIVTMMELDLNTCIGIHRLRKELDIPYDWHERKPERRFPYEKRTCERRRNNNPWNN